MSKQYWIERATVAAREFGSARDAVDEAAATTLGVNRTDLRILGAVYAAGAMSAGAVAAEVGLSPAAVTEAVGRLVAKGLVVRAPDPADRRRAVITASETGRSAVDQVYGPVHAAGVALLARYTSAELELIVEFLDRGRALQLGQAARIAHRDPAPR